MVTRATPQDKPGFIYGVGAPAAAISAPEGTIYLDITAAPYIQYVWNGGAWVLVGTGGATGVAGVAAGYKLARGETALDGGNPTPVATGLTTVIAFAATLKGSAAPGLSTSTLSALIAGAAGNVDVYAWKPTGAGDTTLIASTGTETFYWVAVGT